MCYNCNNNCNRNCGCNSLFTFLFGNQCNNCGCNRCGCHSNRCGCGCNRCGCGNSFNTALNVSADCNEANGCGYFDEYYARQYGLYNTCGCGSDGFARSCCRHNNCCNRCHRCNCCNCND